MSTITIQRVVSRTAYAKSGNAHNPTVTYCWVVRRDGNYVGTFSRLRDAKAFVCELRAAEAKS